jgi:phospholipid/cholesterol/gamma-HCH transport system substrate-binding protein
MRDRLRAATWRLAVFAAVCLLAMFVLFAVFAQVRFEPQHEYTAEFANVGGLKEGDFVRIAGVEVGKVTDLSLRPDTTVAVKFSTDDSVELTQSSRAVIRYDNLYGDRYLALEEGERGSRRINSGATIPLSHTSPALDLDALIGGFRPLFQALQPDQVNALSAQLIQAFQGEGATIGMLLDHTATLTSTLADRDQLVGQVITNLNAVLGTFSGHNTQFGDAVDKLAALTKGLAERKQDISNSVAYTNAAAGSLTDLLTRSRPAIQRDVNEIDRVSSIVLTEQDYFDNLLDTLPEAYQTLGRQGLYGDWFAFYICEVVFKVNGKGGQPVYIKVAGQSSGRCTPK